MRVMILHVFTARLGYKDPDVLDVTARTASGFARAFAPSWGLLKPFLEKRQANPSSEFSPEEWAAYTAGYLGEMRTSYRAKPDAWRELLARPRVVLVCYCTDHTQCHRLILAQSILPKFGATYGGELGLPAKDNRQFSFLLGGGR
jgi:uncharacterized protein YeaO (DUF488 family)